MIRIDKLETFGWETAIRGMRNSWNSWDRSDSRWTDTLSNPENGLAVWENPCGEAAFCIGQNDQKLMKQLSSAGTDHRKFMRMITVSMDILAPLYWWKEFDTYKIGTTVNSCSTMHKIAEKEFTLDDFSHEHLIVASLNSLKRTVDELNACREAYLSEIIKDPDWKKEIWWQIIQLLPSSYNQKRTVMLNYETLAHIYQARKSHKLDEWRRLCECVADNLPFSELFTGGIDHE